MDGLRIEMGALSMNGFRFEQGRAEIDSSSSERKSIRVVASGNRLERARGRDHVIDIPTLPLVCSTITLAPDGLPSLPSVRRIEAGGGFVSASAIMSFGSRYLTVIRPASMSSRVK